jgi:tetratricopeptide (TPR) repeat protein
MGRASQDPLKRAGGARVLWPVIEPTRWMGEFNVSAERFRYKAFISYSHRDSSVAGWLHRALESYRAPKHLIGRETATGTIQKRLGPLFRDRDELPVAADLTGQINDALAATQFLIVLCSTASAKSKWVNQEVINFKRLKGAGSIIAVIVDGEPYASLKPGREAEECFVPALKFQVDAAGNLTDQAAEPIAADLRPGKDGKRMVKLKVLAGLLGVGLDELVRRETQRRQRFMTAVTFASLAGIGVMGALTFNAIEARNEAEVAQERAERQKGQAEGLIEFMLGDLRKKLQPVGRLDALESVGKKAMDYFSSFPANELDEDTLGRRARAMHLVGEIDDARGDLVSGLEAFQKASVTTEQLLTQDPENSQRIYEHAQSVYWLGYIQVRRGLYLEAYGPFQKYKDLASKLTNIDPKNIIWSPEIGHAYNNLGILDFNLGRLEKAKETFETAERHYRFAAEQKPNETSFQFILGQNLSWQSSTLRFLGRHKDATLLADQELKIYQLIKEQEPNNKTVEAAIWVVKRSKGLSSLDQGMAQLAKRYFEEAYSVAESLRAHDPQNSNWAALYGRSRLDLAEAYLRLGSYNSAISELSAAYDLAQALMKKDANVDKWRVVLMGRHLWLSALLNARLEKNTVAERKCIEVIDLLENARQNDAEGINKSIMRMEAQLLLAELLVKRGEKKAADENWRSILQAEQNRIAFSTKRGAAVRNFATYKLKLETPQTLDDSSRCLQGFIENDQLPGCLH